MKAVELMIEFNRLAESVYRIYETADRLDPFDIEGYLNKSQYQYIKERWLSYQTPVENIAALNQAFDELSPVIKTDTGMAVVAAEAGFGSNAKKIDTMPTDYWYYVRSSTKITRTGIQPLSDEWAENMPIGTDKLFRSISGGGQWPIIINPLTYMIDDRVYLIHDGYTTVSQVDLTYLKKPIKLSLDTDNECELPEHLHYDIADYAVRLYLGQQKESAKNDSE